MASAETRSFGDQTVVLVPGMFSPTVTMLPMARRFKQCGYQTVIFRHRYWSETPSQNAARLLVLLQSLQADAVHLLGHSLGGIVIMHALKLNAEVPSSERFADGKVVLIASPVKGSDFAKRLYAKRRLRFIMGCSVVEGVLGDVPDVLDDRQVAVISGSSRRGLAALLHKPSELNDGLVNVAETQLENAQDTICVPQSHALMLFSRHCTDLALQFFQHGRFVEPH